MPETVDMGSLILQVKRNCDISDAKYWGNYTVCGLLLRLHNLYKFENNIPPWENADRPAVLEWIAERERLWAEFEGEDFRPLEIRHKQYAPFDSESVNRTLLPLGVIYGAGYEYRLKPSFFLADIFSEGSVMGIAVSIAGREFVRDLTIPPAMSQGRKIIVRKDIVRHLLWERLNELRSNRRKSSLCAAFGFYGISPDEKPSEDLDRKISAISIPEAEALTHHEVGEIIEGEKLGDRWKDFLAAISGSKAEILARSVKDVLSDTSDVGMLRHIIDERKIGSLGFYIASLRGYRKTISEEMLPAFEKFAGCGDWDAIENARDKCYERSTDYSHNLLNLYNKKKERTKTIEEINREFSHLL